MQVRWLLVYSYFVRHGIVLNEFDDSNQCSDLSNGWDGHRYDALQTSLASGK